MPFEAISAADQVHHQAGEWVSKCSLAKAQHCQIPFLTLLQPIGLLCDLLCDTDTHVIKPLSN
jgi:hypothetical protein